MPADTGGTDRPPRRPKLTREEAKQFILDFLADIDAGKRADFQLFRVVHYLRSPAKNRQIVDDFSRILSQNPELATTLAEALKQLANNPDHAQNEALKLFLANNDDDDPDTSIDWQTRAADLQQTVRQQADTIQSLEEQVQSLQAAEATAEPEPKNRLEKLIRFLRKDPYSNQQER
jgi:dsDNA-binding SOS-regulon protein